MISTDFKNWTDLNEEIRKIWARLEALEEGGTPPEPPEPPEPPAGCLDLWAGYGGGRSDEENG